MIACLRPSHLGPLAVPVPLWIVVRAGAVRMPRHVARSSASFPSLTASKREMNSTALREAAMHQRAGNRSAERQSSWLGELENTSVRGTTPAVEKWSRTSTHDSRLTPDAVTNFFSPSSRPPEERRPSMIGDLERNS